jgi:hypothetical protein
MTTTVQVGHCVLVVRDSALTHSDCSCCGRRLCSRHWLCGMPPYSFHGDCECQTVCLLLSAGWMLTSLRNRLAVIKTVWSKDNSESFVLLIAAEAPCAAYQLQRLWRDTVDFGTVKLGSSRRVLGSEARNDIWDWVETTIARRQRTGKHHRRTTVCSLSFIQRSLLRLLELGPMRARHHLHQVSSWHCSAVGCV